MPCTRCASHGVAADTRRQGRGIVLAKVGVLPADDVVVAALPQLETAITLDGKIANAGNIAAAAAEARARGGVYSFHA